MGLFPYVFTSTSHLTINISIPRIQLIIVQTLIRLAKKYFNKSNHRSLNPILLNWPYIINERNKCSTITVQYLSLCCKYFHLVKLFMKIHIKEVSLQLDYSNLQYIMSSQHSSQKCFCKHAFLNYTL